MINKFSLIALLIIGLLPSFVLAISAGDILAPADVAPQNIGGIQAGKVEVSSVNQLFSYLELLLRWVFGIFFAASVILIIWAGYYYLIGGEDSENINIAKRRITWAAVAIVVAILSGTFVLLISNFLGAQGGSFGTGNSGGSGGAGGSSDYPGGPYQSQSQYWQQYQYTCKAGDTLPCCSGHGAGDVVTCWK
ncbi:hypothetical protein HZC33_01285 [Candidatus Wolfebacteria bacterium]|nr:hypothetical protein [Candidatus Wolfebacteria bacterium]